MWKGVSMSSSGSDRQPIGDGREVRYSDDTTAENGVDDAELLDEVLSQTAAASDAADARSDPVLQSFLRIAHKYQGQGFTLDPIVIDLVDVALKHEFDEHAMPADLRCRTSQRVAQTIFDDPACHERLEAFWMRLSAMQQ